MIVTASDCLSAAAGLALRHLTPGEFGAAPGSMHNSVLGAACFGGEPAAAACTPPADLPWAQVSLQPLAGQGVVEAWQVPAVQGRAQLGAARYAWSDAYLFGAIATQAFADQPLQQAARGIYDTLFAVLARTGYRYLLRAWNYMPAINHEAGEPGGLERYRQFNLGRAAAFEAAQAPTHEGAPAACALGTDSGALCVYFLAMRRPPEPIENPRQVSAYRYPSQYGPHSPTFSRAALVRGDRGARLFISGTASIVGHQTVHVGDVAAQTRETLANIEAVVTTARQRMGDTTAWPLSALSYKAYVRHAADLPRVQQEVAAVLGAGADVLYLRADICRSDLLVEIEGFG